MESFQKTLGNGHFIVTAEFTPPRGSSTSSLEECAAALAKSVDAISVPESEDGARLASLAACGHLAAAGAEPVMHILTRDLNRIALQSALLGAASMGVRNVLCTTGRHQALTTSGSAKGVFDVDPIQLLSIAEGMCEEGKLADGSALDSPIELVLGIDTNPFSDPMELQVMVLEKAARAGASFTITQPVFDLDRFNAWMTAVRERGIEKRVSIIASVMPLVSADDAVALAQKFCHLNIRDEDVRALQSASDQSAAGIGIAADTIKSLQAIEGVRGVHLQTGEDFGLAARIIASTGISRS